MDDFFFSSYRSRGIICMSHSKKVPRPDLLIAGNKNLYSSLAYSPLPVRQHNAVLIPLLPRKGGRDMNVPKSEKLETKTPS